MIPLLLFSFFLFWSAGSWIIHSSLYFAVGMGHAIALSLISDRNPWRSFWRVGSRCGVCRKFWYQECRECVTPVASLKAEVLLLRVGCVQEVFY